MPAPADVTNSFCDLLLSISESAKLNHEHFAGSGDLATKRVQVAQVVVKNAPSLPQKQIKTAFRTAVNLTFTTGFERSANKLNAAHFEADARLFSEVVLGGLCRDAAARGNDP